MVNKDIWRKRFNGFSMGLLFNAGSAWIGCHYSEFNRRYRINIVPFITLWITKRGGSVPSKAKS